MERMHRSALLDAPQARPSGPDTAVRTLALRLQLPTPDLDASLVFYGALGWRTVERLDDGDRRSALLSLPAQPGLQLLLDEAAVGEPIELRLEVDSLPAALRALSACVPWAAARAETARESLCVTDPAGHPVLLVQARR